jgi:integrase
MAYIIERKDRFYVVAYNGIDPITGRERRKWHPAGTDRAVAELIARRLADGDRADGRRRSGRVTVGSFLGEVWLPSKRTHLRATTLYRYRWMVEHYIIPAIGEVPLVALRTEHLDDLYAALLERGGERGRALAPKTVHEVHLIVRNALDLAVRRRLLDANVALAAHSPRRRFGGTVTARTWSAEELAALLGHARPHRLYPAIHLAAHTGMRRGEVAGLRWHDLDQASNRVAVRRSVQCVGGRPAEFGAKTRSSRRNVDLDPTTMRELCRWRRQLDRDGLPNGPDDWVFCNPSGRFLNPQSLSQLFARLVVRSGLPKIRFHDLRHTHASLLVAHGTPIKVVTERLGHAHAGFTMQTYQHLLPGMSADAASRFAGLIAAAGR